MIFPSTWVRIKWQLVATIKITALASPNFLRCCKVQLFAQSICIYEAHDIKASVKMSVKTSVKHLYKKYRHCWSSIILLCLICYAPVGLNEFIFIARCSLEASHIPFPLSTIRLSKQSIDTSSSESFGFDSNEIFGKHSILHLAQSVLKCQ